MKYMKDTAFYQQFFLLFLTQLYLKRDIRIRVVAFEIILLENHFIICDTVIFRENLGQHFFFHFLCKFIFLKMATFCFDDMYYSIRKRAAMQNNLITAWYSSLFHLLVSWIFVGKYFILNKISTYNFFILIVFSTQKSK